MSAHSFQLLGGSSQRSVALNFYGHLAVPQPIWKVNHLETACLTWSSRLFHNTLTPTRAHTHIHTCTGQGYRCAFRSTLLPQLTCSQRTTTALTALLLHLFGFLLRLQCLPKNCRVLSVAITLWIQSTPKRCYFHNVYMVDVVAVSPI